MKYKDILDFGERCEIHPDHQSGMITESMLKQRLSEEIDELRAYIEQRTWVGLKDEEIGDEYVRFEVSKGGFINFEYATRAIETKLKQKNMEQS